jgi:hypothetical protein
MPSTFVSSLTEAPRIRSAEPKYLIKRIKVTGPTLSALIIASHFSISGELDWITANSIISQKKCQNCRFSILFIIKPQTSWADKEKSNEDMHNCA